RDHGAAEDVADVESKDRQHREERVLERVTLDDPPLAQAFRARRRDVRLLQDLDETGARLSCDHRRETETEDERREERAPQARHGVDEDRYVAGGREPAEMEREGE